MSIEAGIRGHLIANPGVSALIGERVYALLRLQSDDDDLDAITFQRISTNSQGSLSGASGLVQVRFQFDCWSKVYERSLILGEAVRLALQGFRGVMGAVKVHSVSFSNAQDFYDEDTETHRRSMDFLIWHAEQKP